MPDEKQNNYEKEDKEELAEERTEYAEDRTDWALERTLLANERTLSSWIRSGIASVAAGVGLAKLLGSIDFPALARSIGGLFVLVGTLIYLIAFWRYRQAYGSLKESGMNVTPIIWVGLIIVGLLLINALGFMLLFQPKF